MDDLAAQDFERGDPAAGDHASIEQADVLAHDEDVGNAGCAAADRVVRGGGRGGKRGRRERLLYSGIALGCGDHIHTGIPGQLGYQGRGAFGEEVETVGAVSKGSWITRDCMGSMASSCASLE